MSSLKDNYELLNSIKIDTNIHLEKYVHKQTKLTVYNVTIPLPITDGFFVLPTETLSNDGCPHTLEHLIFLGSEDYPYKGFLDLASNKCFASGTNAYTSTDHTAYELTTAGSDGFLQILPIYLDHILYPTITNESFITEVHHINGKGENAGVVYCEMQERENKRISKIYSSIGEDLFTSPSGYKSETGGLMKDIRNLKVETIRDFHKSYYRPDNVSLVIAGDVNIDDIFKSIEPIVQKSISKGELKPMERPWTSKLDIFSKDITKTILFPAEEESTGECVLTFKGPKFDEFDRCDAIIILMEYLSNGPTSPLYSTMIDIEESYATDVGYVPHKFSTKFYSIWFQNCDLKRIDQIKEKFLSVLKDIVDNKKFDVERIRDSILQNKLNIKLQFEKKPSKIISEIIIGDILYGNNNLEDQMEFVEIFDKLIVKDEAFWLDLIKTLFLDQPCSEILGMPSIEESKRLTSEETKRLEEQFKSFTPEQLKELDEKLNAAKEFNEKSIPKELFDKIKLPSPDSISFLPISSVRDDKVVHVGNKKEEELLNHLSKSNPKPLPFSSLFNHIESSFINIRVGLNTQNFPDDDLRDLIGVYLELLTMSSAKRDDGTLVTYEQVDKLILKHTIDFITLLGNSSSFEQKAFSQLCFIVCNIEKKHYNDTINLIKLLIDGLVIEPERIKIVVKKMLDEIPHRKENGTKVLNALNNYILFDKKKSNVVHLNYQKQTNILQNIIQILGGDDENDDKEEEEEEKEEEKAKPIEITQDVLSLIDRLNQIKEYFSKRPEEIFISVGGDILDLPNPKDPWIKEFSYLYKDPNNPTTAEFSKPAFQYDVLDRESIKESKGKIMAVVTPGNGSSNLFRLIENGFTYDNIISHEYCSMYLANAYLKQLEGSFWRELRGAGYLYSYDLSDNPDGGFYNFDSFRVSNPEKVLEVGREIIKKTLEQPLDPILFSGAISSSIFEIAQKEKNIASCLNFAFFNQLRGWVSHTYHDFFKLFFNVTEQDIKNAIKKYIEPLFDDSQATILYTSDSNKVEQFLKRHENAILINPETYYK
ncbi:hypothetical protein DICPUDRAFT_148428 [Dictyostelium purpureum]|uniref:Uncharacterized protein n=1 Tax=Dictyostelium purpureum TaxID=5786 RepID=F0ZB39_DICPU|nr:uncharacterized protein DICPUDRAFT_148428 [Dictyostelium purpureum]EGC38852.1 hypothetical protein DICPUDRAFT_148428 [Dictyostelium purpureum]|eukprot:XP_003284646.1 hypothetical protein DICPUDRAFT_148428 [Dictyostelium purpureum]